MVTSWNAGASRIFGYAPEEMIGQPIIRIIPPELRHEEEGILAQLRRGERIDHFDTVRVAKDGRRLFISLTVSPIRNGAGEVVGASKVARDVSERKRSEELQRVLVDELNHRVKNTLATLQAIAAAVAAGEAEPRGLRRELHRPRPGARTRCTTCSCRATCSGSSSRDLVRELVDAGTGDARLRWSGPPAALDSHTAVQMALVLHELASNARKYGALSQPAGRLSVDWTSPRGSGAISARVAGDRRARPAGGSRPGFGTLLIERSLVANGGETSIRYLADGLACAIRLPLPDARSRTSFRPPATASPRRRRPRKVGVAGRQRARRRGRAADRAWTSRTGSWRRGARSSGPAPESRDGPPAARGDRARLRAARC